MQSEWLVTKTELVTIIQSELAAKTLTVRITGRKDRMIGYKDTYNQNNCLQRHLQSERLATKTQSKQLATKTLTVRTTGYKDTVKTTGYKDTYS